MNLKGIWTAVVCWMMIPIPFSYGEYQSHGKRDPFVPLLTESGQRFHPPGLDEEEGLAEIVPMTLQGIVYDPQEESYAVINGQIVRENEIVGNANIVKIGPSTVIVMIDGKPQELVVQSTTEETKTHP